MVPIIASSAKPAAVEASNSRSQQRQAQPPSQPSHTKTKRYFFSKFSENRGVASALRSGWGGPEGPVTGGGVGCRLPLLPTPATLESPQPRDAASTLSARRGFGTSLAPWLKSEVD